MNNFLELENKCKKLKRKQIIKFIIIIFVTITIILGITLSLKEKPKYKKIELNNTKKEIIITKKHKVQKDNIVPPMMEIQFDLNKIKDMSNIKNKDKKEITHNKKIENKSTKNKSTKNKEKNKEKKEITHNKKIENKQKNKILVEQKTITFEKALNIAKKAFHKHNYQKSMKWCKIASKLDNEKAEIWKLYALNLLKLNQKDKAIIVLKTYLKYKKSTEIENLLKRLEK